jgi:hypothetical protein
MLDPLTQRLDRLARLLVEREVERVNVAASEARANG